MIVLFFGSTYFSKWPIGSNIDIKSCSMSIIICSEGYDCVFYLDLLTPLSGQLEATLISNPAAGPPLCVVKAIIVLFI